MFTSFVCTLPLKNKMFVVVVVVVVVVFVVVTGVVVSIVIVDVCLFHFTFRQIKIMYAFCLANLFKTRFKAETRYLSFKI